MTYFTEITFRSYLPISHGFIIWSLCAGINTGNQRILDMAFFLKQI